MICKYIVVPAGASTGETDTLYDDYKEAEGVAWDRTGRENRAFDIVELQYEFTDSNLALRTTPDDEEDADG